jgi:hypothetical protein
MVLMNSYVIFTIKFNLMRVRAIAENWIFSAPLPETTAVTLGYAPISWG